MPPPAFYYDFNSPYSYLAASRIADLLPAAVWRPIAFGFVLQRTGRVPWSFVADISTSNGNGTTLLIRPSLVTGR